MGPHSVEVCQGCGLPQQGFMSAWAAHSTFSCVFSAGFWTFLWFVGFCFLANQWSRTSPKELPLEQATDAARAAIAFSFFSILTWVIHTRLFYAGTQNKNSWPKRQTGLMCKHSFTHIVHSSWPKQSLIFNMIWQKHVYMNPPIQTTTFNPDQVTLMINNVCCFLCTMLPISQGCPNHSTSR